MNGYPIELDLRGRKVVVVGLGAVGSRKARGLLDAGARVLGVDPLGSTPVEGLETAAEPYREAHLNGARLCFAAATPEVNRRVVRDANLAGILVNSASDPASADFRLPIAWRDEPIILTVSTSGACPALARRLLARLAGSLGPELGRSARMIGELRPLIINQYHEIKLRRRVFNDWADLDRLELLSRQDDDAIRRALLDRAERIAKS